MNGSHFPPIVTSCLLLFIPDQQVLPTSDDTSPIQYLPTLPDCLTSVIIIHILQLASSLLPPQDCRTLDPSKPGVCEMVAVGGGEGQVVAVLSLLHSTLEYLSDWCQHKTPRS